MAKQVNKIAYREAYKVALEWGIKKKALDRYRARILRKKNRLAKRGM